MKLLRSLVFAIISLGLYVSFSDAQTYNYSIGTSIGNNNAGGNFLAFGNVANNGVACSFGGGSASANLSTCARTGAGATTVTFTNTQAASYVCTINVNVSNGVGIITNRSTNSISFTTVNLAGTATDLNYDFICW